MVNILFCNICLITYMSINFNLIHVQCLEVTMLLLSYNEKWNYGLYIVTRRKKRINRNMDVFVFSVRFKVEHFLIIHFC